MAYQLQTDVHDVFYYLKLRQIKQITIYNNNMLQLLGN